jgi:hypothetical protein
MLGKKVIRVAFASGDSHMDEKGSAAERSRTYDYFYVDESKKIKRGDFAVVNVHGTLKIVIIREVMTNSVKATRHAVAIFGLDDWADIIAKEEKLQALKEAIGARAKEAMNMKMFRELAGADEGLQALLNEFDELNKDAAS